MVTEILFLATKTRTVYYNYGRIGVVAPGDCRTTNNRTLSGHRCSVFPGLRHRRSSCLFKSQRELHGGMPTKHEAPET